MTIKEIASISGMSGLYKVLKPSKSGVIVESLDDNQKRMLVSANQKVSLLDEISIYTTTENVPLIDVLISIKAKKGDKITVSGKSDNNALKAFMKDVLPEYDENRVYVSDIKKVVSWYLILLNFPTVFEKEEEVKEEKKASKGAKGKKAKEEVEAKKDDDKPVKKVAKTTTTAKPAKQALPKNMNATAAKAPAKKIVSTKKAG